MLLLTFSCKHCKTESNWILFLFFLQMDGTVPHHLWLAVPPMSLTVCPTPHTLPITPTIHTTHSPQVEWIGRCLHGWPIPRTTIPTTTGACPLQKWNPPQIAIITTEVHLQAKWNPHQTVAIIIGIPPRWTWSLPQRTTTITGVPRHLKSSLRLTAICTGIPPQWRWNPHPTPATTIEGRLFQLTASLQSRAATTGTLNLSRWSPPRITVARAQMISLLGKEEGT